VFYACTAMLQMRQHQCNDKTNFLILIQIGNLDNIYLFELVPPASNGGNSLQSIKEITSSDTASQPPRVTPEERLKHEAGVCG